MEGLLVLSIGLMDRIHGGMYDPQVNITAPRHLCALSQVILSTLLSPYGRRIAQPVVRLSDRKHQS